ncbi:hypothetical protein Bca52824_022950 [Brassica carinata]|uniref:Uncharacterized protein n=1 Tax=Brassica carinata TaxID=52824 RepID=A0A8X8ATZ6_BRACI|nr:hypothetical protein Bca52824_022950 [Brassica carinata]
MSTLGTNLKTKTTTSVDEESDDDWACEGDTRVEVDEDEISDHGCDENTRMSTIFSLKKKRSAILTRPPTMLPVLRRRFSLRASSSITIGAAGSVAEPSPSGAGSPLSPASVADPSPWFRRLLQRLHFGYVGDSSASVDVK